MQFTDMTRKRIRDIRHEEFISAAISAIHKRGFASVTMTEIAAEADATAASISYYFGSKDNLMDATMRRLLNILKTALLKNLSTATTPRERLMAIIDANFDDALFDSAQCSVWIQFWSHAPYSTPLSRLHKINRTRVRAHVRAELKHLLPTGTRETARRALQSYMDGVWLEATQTTEPLNPATTRKEARRVISLLLDS